MRPIMPKTLGGIVRAFWAIELGKSKRQAAFPIAAALGGTVLFFLVNRGTEAQRHKRGWGIPMATDIAFTGMVALLGCRVPPV